MKPTADISVRDFLENRPDAIGFFIRHRMLCVGCPTEAFHTLGEVARIHGQDPDRLIEDLCRFLEETEATRKTGDAQGTVRPAFPSA